MSNVIPYFVLAVVALGFFAICYAVFSRGDGESQSKPKTHRNSHVDNNVEAKNDSPTAMESEHGDVTITHTGGTNVYTASLLIPLKVNLVKFYRINLQRFYMMNLQRF